MFIIQAGPFRVTGKHAPPVCDDRVTATAAYAHRHAALSEIRTGASHGASPRIAATIG